ncbi:MAG: CPBP family intramembrane metalloprotease [Clostridia bacterium]|nr:CPBP family intramembrane metalloprotease [Clostridia bacterium]
MDGKKKRNITLGFAIAVAVLALGITIADEIVRSVVFAGKYPYIIITLGLGAIERFLLSIVAILLIIALGYKRVLKVGIKGGILVCLGGMAVALANFPFASFAEGSIVVEAGNAEWVVYIAYCIAVGLFEETAFRGLVFPLVLEKTQDKRHGPALAVILSSSIFALVHLLNLLQGAGVSATVMQIGYTFLVGAMCNVIFIATKSLALPVFVHAVFDVGGLLVGSGMAEGAQWNAVSIPIMAVVSVLVGAYMIFWFFRHETEALKIVKPQDN